MRIHSPSSSTQPQNRQFLLANLCDYDEYHQVAVAPVIAARQGPSSQPPSTQLFGRSIPQSIGIQERLLTPLPEDIFNQIRAGKVIDRTWYFYFSRIVHYRGDFWRATNETVTCIGTQFCGKAIQVSVQVKCISYLSVDGVFIYLVCQLILITFGMELKEELKYSKQITTLGFVFGLYCKNISSITT